MILQVLVCSFCMETIPETETSVLGMDHIPIVVKNLDSAAYAYKAMGFSLKTGRPHLNGIVNQHVKFSNGTELELIMAPEARDSLTAEYVNHVREGEGPLYFGLFTTNIAAVAGQLRAANQTYAGGKHIIVFPMNHPCHPLFFGTRNVSPTDKPEHFAHKNTAFALTKIWLAPDDLTEYKNLLRSLGIEMERQQVNFSSSHAIAQIARVKEGEIIFLPKSFQVVPGHIVVGATVQVTNIETTRAMLTQSGLKIPNVIRAKDGGRSLCLSPDVTHGLWLEFLQSQ